ncbi:unnamed protein product [Rotaria sp. Silwood1]|nr:unnamed protein product [Rotaria sp. Silwood1]
MIINAVNDIPIGLIMEKNLFIMLSNLILKKYWKMFLDKVCSGDVDPRFVVTHYFQINHLSEYYQQPIDEEIFIQWTPLFRIVLGGAVGKYTGGDTSWKDGTEMSWHYWTQPLSNPLSPIFYRVPASVHAMETYSTYISEGLRALLCYTP